jgi:uncharacterized membrane protein YdbT with pleckstrin-like domain
MRREFRQRFTIASKSGILLFTILTFYLFWIKSVVLAMVVVIALAVLIERVAHTTYVFTDDGMLIISHGWLTRKKIIPVNEILKVTKLNITFGLNSFLLLEYGAHKMTSVQPRSDDSFVAELKKRQAALENA